jgi:hypothetical protein
MNRLNSHFLRPFLLSRGVSGDGQSALVVKFGVSHSQSRLLTRLQSLSPVDSTTGLKSQCWDGSLTPSQLPIHSILSCHHHHHQTFKELDHSLTRSSLVFFEACKYSSRQVTSLSVSSVVLGVASFEPPDRLENKHFLRCWWYGYTAMTRSPVPRLQQQDIPLVREVGIWVGEAVKAASYPLSPSQL